MSDVGSIDRARRIFDEVCAEYAAHDSEIMQGVQGERLHGLDVLGWVSRIEERPASAALQVAALFHDIDRIVTPHAGGGFKGSRSGPAYEEHKRSHAKRSADFVAWLLRNHGFSPEIVDRAAELIAHHDDTAEKVAASNDAELLTLVAADALAFFTSIAPRLLAVEGPDRTAEKARFMVSKLPVAARRELTAHVVDDPQIERLRQAVLGISQAAADS